VAKVLRANITNQSDNRLPTAIEKQSVI